MKKKYLAEPKCYRLTLVTVDGRTVAGIRVKTPAFLMVLRRYNSGHLAAFTQYVLRELRMPVEAGLYYVEV